MGIPAARLTWASRRGIYTRSSASPFLENGDRPLAQRIRKGDLVQVISGSDTGKQGRVLAIDREKNKVRVEKVRIQKRHLKPGRKGMRTGGIVEQEGFVDASNVMLVDASRSAPGRVKIETRGGKRVRVFSKSGTAVAEPASR